MGLPRRVASPLLVWPLWCFLLAPACGGGGPAVSPFGAANLALDFDGMTQYATAGNGGFPAAGALQTIEMWVNFPTPTATTTVDFLTMRMDLTSGVELGIRNGDLAIWRVYVDRVLAQAPTLPSANTWHHLAYTYDLTNNALYVDGVSVDAETTPTDDRTPSSVWLGTLDGANQLYAGKLDEIRVWTLVRTAAEIQADMKHSPPGAVPGLVAYWTFDDGTDVGRARDASGSGNDVTLGDGIASNTPTRVPSTAPDGQ